VIPGMYLRGISLAQTENNLMSHWKKQEREKKMEKQRMLK
jgi:hypothetical protein